MVTKRFSIYKSILEVPVMRLPLDKGARGIFLVLTAVGKGFYLAKPAYRRQAAKAQRKGFPLVSTRNKG